MLIVLTIASVNQDILAQPVVGAGQVPGSQNPSGTILAARWRGFGNNVQRRIYVGWGNIGTPGPTGGRQETTPTFATGSNTNTITLVYNAATFSLAATLRNNGTGQTWTATFLNLNATSISAQLCRLNYLNFSLQNNIGNSAQVNLSNLILNGNNLGSFVLPFNGTATSWNISNFDFSQSWTLTGTLDFGSGNLANSESGKLEVSVGVRNPMTSTTLTSFCAGGNTTVSYTGLLPNRSYTVNYDIAGAPAASPSFTTDASGNGSFSIGPLTAANYNQLFTTSSVLASGGCTHAATVLNTATLLENSGCAILPVTFGQVDARENSQGVQISWTTVTETNNSHFLVERSMDGRNWSTIGKVNGQGNSSIIRQYIYVDTEDRSGRLIYRVRQVDFDGQFSFSKTRIVDRRTRGRILITPVPATDQLTIDTQGLSSVTEIQVISYSGAIVYHQKKPGRHQQIRLESWRAGTYVVKLLFADGSQQTHRIIKQ